MRIYSKLESYQDIEDFVRGCTFMGTGGGGSPRRGLEFLKEDISQGKVIELLDPESIPDDVFTCSAYYMGSIAPETEEAKREMEKLGYKKVLIERELVSAIKELQSFTGKKIEVIVPIELGGINTPGPIDAAINMNLKIVDGDYAGRAIPEIEQTTPSLLGKAMWPISSCDKWGNAVIIKSALNYSAAEKLGKAISTAAYGLVGQAGFLMSGKEAKECIIKGTLSKCLHVGKAIRQARETGRDPIKAIISATDGWLLFKGKVVKKDWADKGGYLIGTSTMDGIEEFKGHTFKIWYKNENHISWFDAQPYVTSPDLISCVHLESGEPITNTEIKEGDLIAVIGVKGRDEFRTERGLEVLGPKSFGFEIEYKPVEKIVGKF